MSGLPAPPAAAAPAPPRLLLYVGDPGGPQPPRCPPDSHPRPSPLRPPDHHHRPGPLYYKDNGYPDAVHLRDSYPNQTYVKVEGKGDHTTPKKENGNPTEYANIETFQGRLHGDSGEIYQRCLPDSGSSMQPVLYRQSYYGECLRNGNSANSGEKELIEDKNYVNYQFLEHNATNQSLVNQSISVLNQQVGVSAVDSAVVGVQNPVLAQTQETDRTLQSDPFTTTVPLGWRRIITGVSVCYISPSGTQLNTLRQLREYLQTTGTCKCGLSCPFRPETAFSFDPKVASKSYLPPTGAELTKLCNHKRKLLATISARAQEGRPPSPPSQMVLPPDTNTAGPDLLKKKSKKRSGFPAMAAQQMMVQNNRHPNDIKMQEMEQCRTTSPGVVARAKHLYPNMTKAQEYDRNESQVRSSHYLTVNSGWILQEMAERNNQAQLNASLNMGLPVIGTNGQIIGVNTSYKHNYKGVPIQVQEDKKEPQREKEDDAQMYCSLNQITPEVMQKINEQQQLFIQQNQKQIEMAMKGYRNQMENQKPYSPQVVIQNGAIMKTNPAKTPPWQVKRNDSMTSPSPKSHKSDLDFEDTNANLSEESNASNTSFQSNEMNQAMCSRVPPLPQHYNMMGQQWPPLDNKKKPKTPKGSKKKADKNNFMTNGMKLDQKKCDDIQVNNIPSFMDDPTGYLAQQTALLNNTISRQVGMNSYENQFEGNCYVNQEKKKCVVQNVYRNNMVPNASPSPNNTPDSSEKSIESCCKGCNVNVKGTETYTENQIRRTYSKNMYNKMDSSPKHYEDSPVTSSTFIDRIPMLNEVCGPIQARTVSTSNVSPSESLLPPEPSPTPSNSSRNTDTPLSHTGNGNSQNYPVNSPYNQRETFSNPSTPGGYYNQPQSNQMMHFISNHNVNKNLMEVDNISMVGVRGMKQDMYRKDNAMPGYCPPPHLGGGPAHSLIQAGYVQTFVTTMASGFSVTRDTITSVLAGKATTTTTSINASHANFIRPPPPPSVNLATTYAIPNNQPDPFIHSVNLPTSYPLHIAGTTAQNMISKSPLEMVQHVIGNIPNKTEHTNQTTNSVQMSRRSSSATPGQILISSTGQIIVSNSSMPPPPPKTSTAVSISSVVTNVTSSVTQVIPNVGQGGAGQAVVVNNNNFMMQPPLLLDGQLVPGAVLPQLLPGMLHDKQMEMRNGQGCVQMLSPDIKKKSKKRKSQNLTNVLQINAPQQNIMVHQSPPNNTSPQFSPRGFQLSPNNNISPPMLQALTIVPGKSGTPAHIVMNGQGNTNNFGSQQILANTSPSQQINLLQPVNLLNNASMPNFPAFQQFIVPNLGGMMMTADGTTIIQENSAGVPMQLQLQTVNGQNVLTPVQNPGVFTGANGGVVLRAQNQQGKIIQSQHSPGAQFLSPNSQVMLNSPNFNGQLSPLLANLSPTNVTFNTSPHQVRSNNVQAQEFIQTNQMGQTLMVPLSPKQSIAATNNRTNSTFVQQNTTIVQQQTTLVSNSHNNHVSSLPMQQGNGSRLSIDPHVLLNATKQITKSRNFIEIPEPPVEEIKDDKFQADPKDNYSKFVNDFSPQMNMYGSHVRHSVSTQTLVNQQRGKSPNVQAISPPDTTTHSPLGALENTSSPRMYGARSTQGNYADTTTKSPEPADASSSAMVQCVSSSEQDMAESPPLPAQPPAPPAPPPPAPRRAAPPPDYDAQNLMSNMQLMRQTRHTHNSVESTEIQYNHSLHQNAQQNMMPNPNYFERSHTYKRKNEFEPPSYRDKVMRGQYNNMVQGHKDEFDLGQETPKRYFPGSSSEPNKFDRLGLGTGNDTKTDDIDKTPKESAQNDPEKPTHKFQVGDLIWGPVKGYASWPGKLMAREEDGRWQVKWFGGDKAPGQADDAKLLTLSEGLEAHHAARTKHRKSRKLNTHLENAIQEAMAELDKTPDATEGEAEEAAEEGAPLTETPKRKKDKKKDKKKSSNLVKIAPKTGESRLRSAR